MNQSEIDRIATFLAMQGVQEGHIVAAFLPTGHELIHLLLATLRCGAVFCPLHLRLSPRELQEQLNFLKPRLFFSADGCQVQNRAAHPLPPSSLLLFTSGSTAAPKVVCLTESHLLANAKSAANFCDLRPSDTWFLSLPLYHVGGLSILFRCLSAEANFTFDSANPAITHLSCVPAQLYRAWPIYKNLKCLLLGGGPVVDIPHELPIAVTYAMTETASMILAKRSPKRKDGLLHLGFPLPGKELKLTPDGEILVRGDSLFQGYWNGITLENSLDPDGWFATKDLGQWDPVEGFAIIGRKDNQFIAGGENIQPEEIERELLQFPGVSEAIIVPEQDPRFGFRPVAFLRANTIDPTALRNFLSERLPKFKIPTAFFSLDLVAENGLKLSRKKIVEYLKNSNLK